MSEIMVKVCGLRTPDEVRMARHADAVGCVVRSPKSPRNLPLEPARDILALRGDHQRGVAVTVETDPYQLQRILRTVEPDVLQLHRGVAPATANGIRKDHPVVDLWFGTTPADGVPEAEADAVLVDTRTDDGYGGTGTPVDRDAAVELRDALHPTPMILAGGLTPENVAEAIRHVDPWGVDASSGLEGPHGKHASKVQAFVRNARNAKVNP